MKIHKELQLRGSERDIDAVARLAQAQLPQTWERVERADGGLADDYIIFHFGGSPQVPAATLFLHNMGGAARVVNIIPDSADALTIDQYNRILEDFANVVRPIAVARGINVTESSDEVDTSHWLSERGAQLLNAFSRGANKSTGSSHPLDFQRWADFILEVFTSGQRIPVDLLARYLVEIQTWPDDQARELVLQYEFSLGILDRARDTGVLADE